MTAREISNLRLRFGYSQIRKLALKLFCATNPSGRAELRFASETGIALN